jgi:hypothetical protein
MDWLCCEYLVVIFLAWDAMVVDFVPLRENDENTLTSVMVNRIELNVPKSRTEK